MFRLVGVLVLFFLSGCSVVSVATDVVSTTVGVATSVVGAAVDVVTPGGE